MILQVTLFIIAILALYFGAEFALDGAEKIGKFFKLSPLVIGLLIIGFGTSLPEFFVSQMASYRGVPTVAIGNILGSNIANMFLVLGISALFCNLSLKGKEISTQLIFHLVLSLGLIGILYYSSLNILTTVVLGVFFGAYLFIILKSAKHETNDEIEVVNLATALKLLAGFGLLFGGGELLVSSITKLGLIFGIDEYIISAIFVAFGTSFPELITAILACVKKKDTDLIVGNIIGSNVFNIAFVMGSLGVYKINGIGAFINDGLTILFGAIIIWILSLTIKSINKLGGMVFLGIYILSIVRWMS